MIHFCLLLMRAINTKYRKIFSQVLLVFYLTVSFGFIFHYHHINLSTESIIFCRDNPVNNSANESTDRDGFVCIIHSNFQSLHQALQTQIISCCSSVPLPSLNIVEYNNTSLDQLQQVTSNPFRAPPFSFC